MSLPVGTKFIPPFTFLKAVQWALIESFQGQFLPLGLVFDTPDVDPQTACRLLFEGLRLAQVGKRKAALKDLN